VIREKSYYPEIQELGMKKKKSTTKRPSDPRPSLHRDLDSFFASWTTDSKIDRALADQRKIDPKLWR
jgi:hypothetical protein